MNVDLSHGVSRLQDRAWRKESCTTRRPCFSPSPRRHTATGVPLEQRLAFFRELRHGYGRTGLCLSGGASFGFYHVGVWIELLKQGLLPKVLTGSSAGSIGGQLQLGWGGVGLEACDLGDSLPYLVAEWLAWAKV